MKIKVINKSKHQLPQYSTGESAGMDLRANLDKEIILKPLERIMVPTGLFIEIPIGYEAQIRPRSGLAIKKGITILNSPGTIDADYRGEVCIVLVTYQKFLLRMEKFADVCYMKKAEWESVDILLDTERGIGGFGHTGKK